MKNLHTLYFESLFSGEQSIIDIGKGEIFYRKANKNYKPIIHKKGVPIVCKTYKEEGKIKTLPEKLLKKLNEYFSNRISKKALEQYINKEIGDKK